MYLPMRNFNRKIDEKEREHFKSWYRARSSDERKTEYDANEAECKKFFETDSYKNGETDTEGYALCCDCFGMCGLSGGMIFLIILIVLLCLAGAAAAFWFFYYKRKKGGRDEEKEIENSGHDISGETY